MSHCRKAGSHVIFKIYPITMWTINLVTLCKVNLILIIEQITSMFLKQLDVFNTQQKPKLIFRGESLCGLSIV